MRVRPSAARIHFLHIGPLLALEDTKMERALCFAGTRPKYSGVLPDIWGGMGMGERFPIKERSYRYATCHTRYAKSGSLTACFVSRCIPLARFV